MKIFMLTFLLAISLTPACKVKSDNTEIVVSIQGRDQEKFAIALMNRLLSRNVRVEIESQRIIDVRVYGLSEKEIASDIETVSPGMLVTWKFIHIPDNSESRN